MKRYSLFFLLIGLFCLILAFAIGVRVFSDYRQHGPPRARQTNVSSIAGWMTIPHISRAYGVPPPELFQMVGADPVKDTYKSIDAIARDQGIPSDQMLKKVRETIVSFQAAHQKPPGILR